MNFSFIFNLNKSKIIMSVIDRVDNFFRKIVYGILDRRRDYLIKNIDNNPEVKRLEKEIEDGHKEVTKMVRDLANKDPKFKAELEKNGYIWDDEKV